MDKVTILFTGCFNQEKKMVGWMPVNRVWMHGMDRGGVEEGFKNSASKF